MRQRLHYTPSQITKNLYTTGSEWMTSDDKEYLGPYHTYITGEVYTGSTWNPKTSQKLFPIIIESETVKQYKKIKTVQTKFETPNVVIPTITNTDRANGYVTRYFLYKPNQQQLVEIDVSQYTKWQSKSIDNNIYYAFKINWWITGSTEDVYANGVLTKGVVTKNIDSLRQLESNVPEIFTFFTNLLEYYSDSDYVVPKDIND